MLLFCLMNGFAFLRADVPDSTRITYKIPTRVKVNNAFPVQEKPVSFVSKSLINDSLQRLVISAELAKDSLVNITSEQEARLQTMEMQVRKLSEENKNVSNELENANGDKLQSSHTNSILYIFLVIVAILLLITLVWMTGKKKFRDTDKIASNGYAINGSHEVYAPVPALDHRLDRIEKLGNLRDKGLLTDEEFDLQIEDKVFEQLVTVGDLLSEVEKKVNSN